MKRFYCTYFDSNYLTRALALFDSLQMHETCAFEVFAICMDDESFEILKELAYENIIPINFKDFEKDDQELLAVKPARNIVEYYFTATPTIILRIIERFPQIDILTYLDADLYFFSSPQPIFDELENHSVLIHEHRFSPTLAYLERETGKYNVGLLCFRNNAIGLEVLHWWRDRCLEWCHFYYENGKMGDQMYLNDWVERFEDLVVLNHIGAAVAPWNHAWHTISGRDSNVYIDSVPLIFYHFHALVYQNQNTLIPMKVLGTPYPVRRELLQYCYIPYAKALQIAFSRIHAFNPNFNKGVGDPEYLKPEYNFLTRVPLPFRVRIFKARTHISGDWVCYFSLANGDCAALVNDPWLYLQIYFSDLMFFLRRVARAVKNRLLKFRI